MKLLLIARHHSPAMHRKAELLQAEHGWTVHYAIPARWHDALASDNSTATPAVSHKRYAFIGSVDDPHRATWRTADFGMRALQPDIIVAEEEPDSVAALHAVNARRAFASRAKLVLYTWQNVDRPLGSIAKAVRRHNLSQSDGILCANTAARQLLQTWGYTGRTEIVPSIGVDSNRFYPCDAQSTKHGDPFRVGYAGRLLKEKGIDVLLEALALTHPTRVVGRIIGNGPVSAQLQARSVSLGLEQSVMFIPSIQPEEMRSALCELDALVLPSLSMPHWQEQFGRILAEAMACGIPVVGSNSGAIPEVIADAGIIVPENDPAALAGAIEQLAQSAELRGNLRMRGLARVFEHYTQKQVASVYSRFLTGLGRL